MNYKTLYKIVVFLLTLVLISCDDDWLEVKRDRALIVPTTLKDMRLLITNEILIREDYVAIAKVSADEYYITTERWNTMPNTIKNAYLWKEEIYEANRNVEDWDKSYNEVLTANVILDGLKNIQPNSSTQEEWNDIKGGALHLRARAFYNLAQSFAKPYDVSTADSDLGIPLKLSSDINTPTVRATLKETYDQILSDLTESVNLLKEVPIFKTDASKPAAYGMLARCYLSMRDYDKALISADACLQLYSTLLDYNTLNAASNTPFPRFNEDVIQHTQINPLWSVFIPSLPNFVYPDLYNSYAANDLRRGLFFRNLGGGNFSFKGSYTQGSTPFNGITTDEMYLIRAECYARQGNTVAAMADLNTLLVTRFATGTFVPLTAATPTEALNTILTERKKELIGRGLRWSDLRRLNQEPAFAITLTRTIDGIDYSLPPNDARYVLPIPDYIINISNIQQNIR